MTFGQTKSAGLLDLRADSVIADVATAFCMDGEEAGRFSRKWITRLEPIAHFGQGDQAIIRRGLAHLALNMVDDYRRDVDIDQSIGKYNPVAAGVWDAESIAEELEAIIEATESPELDHIVYGDGGGTTQDWWMW